MAGLPEYGAEMERAEALLTCAVLSIMVTAPLFAAVIAKVGQWVLDGERHQLELLQAEAAAGGRGRGLQVASGEEGEEREGEERPAARLHGAGGRVRGVYI